MYKVLKFGATWCNPCQQLEITLEGQELPCEFESVNIDEFPEIATKYAIRGVPTLVLFNDTKEISRISGAKSLSEIKGWLAREMV
jgi:thioredoxin-like negative regulator of GroEL